MQKRSHKANKHSIRFDAWSNQKTTEYQKKKRQQQAQQSPFPLMPRRTKVKKQSIKIDPLDFALVYRKPPSL